MGIMWTRGETAAENPTDWTKLRLKIPGVFEPKDLNYLESQRIGLQDISLSLQRDVVLQSVRGALSSPFIRSRPSSSELCFATCISPVALYFRVMKMHRSTAIEQNNVVRMMNERRRLRTTSKTEMVSSCIVDEIVTQ